MFKFLIKLIIFFGIIFGGFFFAFNFIFTKASKQAISIAITIASEQGIEFQSLDFNKAGLSSLTSLSWYDIKGTYNLKNFSGIKKEAVFLTNIDQLSLNLANILTGDFTVQAQGLGFATLEKSADKSTTEDTDMTKNLKNGKIVLKNALYSISLGELTFQEFKNPEIILRKLFTEAENTTRLLITGEIQDSFLLEGHVEFFLGDKFFEVKIEPRKQNDSNTQKLALNEEQLLLVAENFNTELSATEVKLISQYPLRVPKLLQIKVKAEKESSEHYSDDDNKTYRKKDAYKYVPWSYLLTKEYGEEFAKEITDAHEEEKIDQSNAEKNMDIQNASVGRSYFSNGVSEAEILSRMASDSRVIFSY